MAFVVSDPVNHQERAVVSNESTFIYRNPSATQASLSRTPYSNKSVHPTFSGAVKTLPYSPLALEQGLQLETNGRLRSRCLRIRATVEDKIFRNRMRSQAARRNITQRTIPREGESSKHVLHLPTKQNIKWIDFRRKRQIHDVWCVSKVAETGQPFSLRRSTRPDTWMALHRLTTTAPNVQHCFEKAGEFECPTYALIS